MNESRTGIVGRAVNWIVRKPLSEKTHSVVSRYYAVENALFEKAYGFDFYGNIDKKDLVADSKFSLDNSSDYQPYGNPIFKHLINQAIADGGPFARFIDIGCGKGKQCVYAARYFSFPEIIGIEFSKPLADAARRNLERFGSDRVQVLDEDATRWHIPDGRSVVFLFNPFNDVILDKFIARNRDHFRTYGSVIAYGNDRHRDVLERYGFQATYRSPIKNNSIYRLPTG